MRKLWIAAAALSLGLAACGQHVAQPDAVADSSSAPVSSDPSASSLPTLQGLHTSVESQASDPFNITLRFVGNPSASFKKAAQTAAARWEKAITQGLPSVTGKISPKNDCDVDAPDFNGTVDDIMIDVGVEPIDGAGNILAESGPCLVRSSGGLTIYGSLIFDSADLSGFQSQLSSILVHEMGHSLGIGTLWDEKNLLVGGGSSNPTFKGAGAVREWHTLGGAGNVPVENTGGPGTAGGHWRETTFDNELMTGYINDGFNPLSRMSIASLGDLGYKVNLSTADAYSLPKNIRKQGVAQPFNETLFTPKFQVQ